ncbi:MAG: sigma-70 family RNA polymerase sigma factor [Planctomycetes bacterium]|nr:sigma-70 family RNA polymerase sigma factor [Planctomycetota bacterium]
MTDLASKTDEELMHLCKVGDEPAFTILYERHKSRIINFAYRLLGNYEDAVEVLQEAFTYAFRKAADWEERAKFTTLMYKVTRNLSLNKLEREKKRRHGCLEEALIVTDGADDAGEIASKRELHKKILGILDEMPQHYRDVIHLRMFESLAYNEIAEVVGIPEGTVKSRLHNGLELLRQEFVKATGAVI